MAFRISLIAFALIVAFFAHPGVPQQVSLEELQITRPDAGTFLPPTAVLNRELAVDFENDGVVDIVLAYVVPDERANIRFTTGVRVLKYTAVSGWAVAFEETDLVDNGAGASAAITIEKVRSTNGKDGVVVILHYSGAGTATAWHVLASVRNKISRLDPAQLRARVFKQKGYQDWGYNGLTSKGNLVIESQPGYSPNTARCCADRPSIEMRFQFTGSSIELESVKELPFSPTKY